VDCGPWTVDRTTCSPRFAANHAEIQINSPLVALLTDRGGTLVALPDFIRGR
jgi:hypothetical protein